MYSTKKILSKKERIYRNQKMFEMIKKGYKQKVVAEIFNISCEHLSRIKKNIIMRRSKTNKKILYQKIFCFHFYSFLLNFIIRKLLRSDFYVLL